MSATTESMIGKDAPLFCLPDPAGVDHCLKTYLGNWIVLYFYPRDNTPGCTMEAIQFNRSLENIREHGAVLIGISPDTSESHKKFQERHGLNFLLLSDPDHRVLDSYRVWRPKVLFGKELLGVERSTFLINPRGKIVEVWRKVRVSGHVEAVLAALEKHRKEVGPPS